MPAENQMPVENRTLVESRTLVENRTLIENRGTFRSEDVTLLLTDITGQIEPKATAEREILIQSGVHYSEMLPLEYKPSERYIAEYYRALDGFAAETAAAVMTVAEKIYSEKRRRPVLVSLARAGTPAGILIKRYLFRKYGIDAPHYTISVVRGRGIDAVAMRHILDRHAAGDIQFIDGWTGKGAILSELSSGAAEFGAAELGVYEFGAAEFMCKKNKRLLLAVLADPANITDMCGTHEDIPIASSFLNSTVCGLMSRTVIRPGIGGDEFHGVAFYGNLKDEDKTYEYIERIEKCFDISEVSGICREKSVDGSEITGMDEVKKIAEKFEVSDINFIKPGIGEATRVLLRRVPDMVLLGESAEDKYIAHLIQLAEEKQVPIIRYPLRRYKACGIIKALTQDV